MQETTPKAARAIDAAQWNTNYSFVFVHGIAGWGSYDPQYRLMPYWGLFGGDLLRFLNAQGFHAVAASVDPNGSAWDRACELYAQFTGTRVDYGVAHSKTNGHARFGRDYTGRALVRAFSETNKLNLLGHSFGGTTIRQLAYLLEHGSAEEQAATPEADLSPLFTGGKGDWIRSITALATPHNGTTAYYETSGAEKRMGSLLQQVLTRVMEAAARKKTTDRIDSDHAEFDMDLDRARAINAQLTVSPQLYYFSFPCCVTQRLPDGGCRVLKDKTEIMFRAPAELITQLRGTTSGGIVYGDDWADNDGLVNTISATAPFGAPQKDFDENDIPKGVWNVMPVTVGDHMALEGGLFLKNDVRALFAGHLDRINRLP